jgi:hypothetical protein
MELGAGEAGVSPSRKLGIASLAIAGISMLVFLPGSVVGAIVALVGLFGNDRDGRRRFDWLCLVALLLNAAALIVALPFMLTAFGY